MMPDRHTSAIRWIRRSAADRRGASGPTRWSLVAAALALVSLSACGDDGVATTSATTSPASSSTEATPATSAAVTTVPATTEVTREPASTETTTVAGKEDDAAIEATRAIFGVLGDDDPGCTIAVGRDGDVVYAEAFGAARLDPSEPMTTETIVDIGSTSKQFTATAILLLAQDGSLGLDDVVADHVPGLPEWSTRITVRQMMHHTSGIPDYIDLLASSGFELTGSSTDADALAALAAATELDFEPGTSWAYSNSNYFLMGQVVLSVSGMPLDEFLDAEVFQPLGLAMVMDPVAALPGKAVSYEGTGATRTVADSRWEQLGDGGVQTTPSELVRWASQYWRPTIGGDAITAARLDDAAEIVDPLDPTSTVLGRYGAGIQILDDPTFGTVLSHSGGWGGFVTGFTVIPSERFALAATCTSLDTLATIGLTNDAQLLEPWLVES